MAKIIRDVLYNFIANNPTGKEIDFFLYLSQYQDEEGIARGIYYREVCNTLPCCKQTFYNMLRSLEQKEIIKITRESEIDYDIQICGVNETLPNQQYLYARKPILHTMEFKKLTAGAKLIALDLLMITGANDNKWEISKENFITHCINLLPFDVKESSLLDYIRQLNKLFEVIRIKHKNLLFILKRTGKKRPDDNLSDSKLCTHHFVSALCRRLRVRYYSPSELNDSAALITQYKLIAQDDKKSIFTLFKEVFYKSWLHNTSKLQPKLIHKYLRSVLYGEPEPVRTY